jgi:universal stress protein E
MRLNDMQRVRSILVALDKDRDSRGALERSVMLARCFDASLDLFLCEAERAYALQHQYDPGSTDVIRDAFLTDSRAWMQSQWRALDVNDISVSMDPVCESPLCDAIRRKVQQCGPLLVVRGIGGRECAFTVADSDVVPTCPAPLLLTRGRMWRVKPKIAAAVDISGDESPHLTRSILSAAAEMAEHSGAQFEVLYAQRPAPAALERSRAQLTECVTEAKLNPSQLHVIVGDPAIVIPQVVARQDYEMLVLGALTHRKAMTAQVGSLTGRLVETLDRDLLLVKTSETMRPLC